MLINSHPYVGSVLAPNQEEATQWRESLETVFTNARGWRVIEPWDRSLKVSLMFFGDSICFGMGVPAHESFVVKMLPEHRVGNIGVPSHSLLQVARLIEIEIPLVKKNFVLVFHGGMINRCVKENAYKGVIFRPIFMRSPNGDLVEKNPRQLPLPSSLLRRVPRRIASINNALARPAGAKRMDGRDLQVRREMLQRCMARISATCERNGVRALVWHYYNMRNLGTDDWRFEEEDRKWFEDMRLPALSYESWDGMKRVVADKTVYFQQHEHLNPSGNEIVASAMRPLMEEFMGG